MFNDMLSLGSGGENFHMSTIDKAAGTMTVNTPVSLTCDFEPKYVIAITGKGGSAGGLYIFEWDMNDVENVTMSYYVGDQTMNWERYVGVQGRLSRDGNTVSYIPINSVYASFALQMIAFG